MRALTCLLPGQWLVFTVGLWAACGLATPLTAQVINADETGATGGGVAEASYTSSGSYFSRELGTPLRFGYHSEGYGTETGVVSLGTMKVFNLDGATWFLDGQGTMSDDFGGGFNAGIGYRELVNRGRGFDPERILGASFWTDGQNTRADNFFTQLGFGLESLGESFDLRMNGYFPLERTKSSDPTLIDFDTVTFSENRLFAGIERIRTDTAHSVVDAEAAKRLGNLDAWAIAGIYQLGGGGADDTGYRLGVRGYALPDLLVGVQVTDDDLYNTNVMATLTWFVGRTHKGNAPVGAIVDRFREPVFRNDFISTTTAETTQGAGGPLTDADNDELFNFIHVDPNAADGGDGSFENPFNNLADAQMILVEDAYVYVHSNAPTMPPVALTPTASFTLLDNVKFWGEGTNQDGDVVQHAVDTVERGSLFLPETTPGAEDFESPTIDASGTTDFLVLADNNDVNNFRINGGTNTIVGDAINAPQLANLDINDPTGTGISLTEITGTTVIDNTVTIDGAATGMRITGGSEGMNINAQITNSIGSSLIVENREGGTIAYGGSIQDDNAVAATAAAIVIQNNESGTINFTQTLNLVDDLGINVDSGNFNTLFIDGNTESVTMTFADLLATAADADTIRFNGGGNLTINDSDDDSLISNTGTGDAFHHEGSAVANEDSTITVTANITNSGGGNAVEINNHTENNITFSGDITDTDSAGILLTGNTGGTIAFNGAVDVTNTGAGNGVTISGGGDDVTYQFTDININVTTGTGFTATGDGTLIVTSADGDNMVQTTTGQAINIEGLTIGAGGAIFDEVNVINGANDSVVLRNLEGAGQVRIGGGTDPGDGGLINNLAGTGITIDNANNVAVTNVEITNSSADEALLIINQEAGATITSTGVEIAATGAADGLVIGTAANPNEDGTVTFTELVASAVNGNAVTVQNNTGGTYIFNDLTASTSGTGDAVFINANSDDTIVTFNDMNLDATNTGDGFFAQNGGEITVTGDTTVDTVSGVGVTLDDVTVGAAGAQFDTVNVTAGTTNGVLLRTVAGTGLVTIGSGVAAGAGGEITSDGDAIVVDNANNVAITRVTVDNDAVGNNGDALVIQNQDGGTVSVTGLTARTNGGTGIVADNNTGGTNIYSNSDIDVVGAGNGVTLTDNTGATNTFNTIDIDATTGTGFAASGGGIIAATGTNTVTTTTGVGVNLSGMEIGAAGFNLNSVNVTNGATNGVVLTNLTGGNFRQGAAIATGIAGNGGTLTTTGDAILLSGVTNAVFNDVTANSTGALGRAAFITHTVTTPATIIFDNLTSTGVAIGGNGVELVDNGTGELDFTLRNSNIDMTLGNDNAFLFTAGANTGEVDVRLEDNSLLTGNAVALNTVINAGTGNVQFLVTGNTVNNNSAANAAANFVVGANRTLNATVGSQGNDPADGNAFSNAIDLSFAATTTGGASRINLDLQDNTGNNPGVVQYELTITAGAFGVVERDDTFNNLLVPPVNNGNVAPGGVNVVGDFIDLTGPITQVD
ncbi:MAG: hypothetical protein SH868_07835 [Bythopirellula sp.]|nr:hypothetical protein [Bythopirellula sp.]